MRVQAGTVKRSLHRTKRQFTEEYLRPIAREAQRAAEDYAENVLASDMPYIDKETGLSLKIVRGFGPSGPSINKHSKGGTYLPIMDTESEYDHNWVTIFPAGLNPSEHYTFTSGRTIRMLRDQILIRLLHPERMTASKLLWIPDNAQRPESELYQGLVLAVGPGKDYGHGRLLPDVRPGDRCVFYWGAGEIAVDRLYDDSEELRILAEGSIQGIWR